MKRVAFLTTLVICSLLVACGPSAPAATPTPEPRPTPVEVLATKPEHLAGTWRYASSDIDGYYYHWLFEADGTMKRAMTLELLQETEESCGRFWFQDGVYYEESRWCYPIGSYRVYLTVEGRSVVSFRFEEIDDPCGDRRYLRTPHRYVRLDR